MEMLFCSTVVGLPFLIPPIILTGELFTAWKSCAQECDFNLDGVLNREEFVKFIKHSTKDTFFVVSQGLIVTLAVTPTVALLTKRSTEGIPHVGRIVQKLPTSVYASIITLAVVLFQNSSQAIE